MTRARILGLCVVLFLGCGPSSSAPTQAASQPESASSEDMAPEVGAEQAHLALLDDGEAPVLDMSAGAKPLGSKDAQARKAMRAKDMKALESQPGASAPLRDEKVDDGPGHEDLLGSAGISPASGPADALVRVYVFSDFQCPVCRRVVEPVKELLKRHPKDVQVIFKQNALEMHRHAAGAAAASLAAMRQGKFWAYHDLLFQNQRELQPTALLRYAEALGLDMATFKADMNSEAIQQQIVHERDVATRLGARGTPGFFINGRKLVGWGSYGGFKSMVEMALKKAKGLVDQGTSRSEVARRATMAQGEDGKQFAHWLWGAEAP